MHLFSFSNLRLIQYKRSDTKLMIGSVDQINSGILAVKKGIKRYYLEIFSFIDFIDFLF